MPSPWPAIRPPPRIARCRPRSSAGLESDRRRSDSAWASSTLTTSSPISIRLLVRRRRRRLAMARREPSGTEEPALSPPVEELFPSRHVREQLDDLLSRELAESQELIARGSVTPTIDLDAFRT